MVITVTNCRRVFNVDESFLSQKGVDAHNKMGEHISIKPFSCEEIDKALLRTEWERWIRFVELYLASKDITDVVKKRNKLLHLGGSQLQEVAYNLPGAIENYDEKQSNDVFSILKIKLTEHFSPKRNSTFERLRLSVIRTETPSQRRERVLTSF